MTKPIHGSQKKVRQDEKGLVIEIEVIPNYELEQLILSYGEAIQVLYPFTLKDKIKVRIASALSNYNQKTKECED